MADITESATTETGVAAETATPATAAQASQATAATAATATAATAATVTGTTYEDVRETIRNEVYDPELGLNVVDLGLIYDVDVADHKADITMTLTSPGCPVGPELITNIRRALSKFEDLDEIDVTLVFSPPWHPSMMSEEAKDELGYFG